jgi:hypothetical protein
MRNGITSCCVAGDLKRCRILGHCELKHQQFPAEHAHLNLTFLSTHLLSVFSEFKLKAVLNISISFSTRQVIKFTESKSDIVRSHLCDDTLLIWMGLVHVWNRGLLVSLLLSDNTILGAHLKYCCTLSNQELSYANTRCETNGKFSRNKLFQKYLISTVR